MYYATRTIEIECEYVSGIQAGDENGKFGKERFFRKRNGSVFLGQDSFGGFISNTELVVFIAGYRFHWSNAK